MIIGEWGLVTQSQLTIGVPSGPTVHVSVISHPPYLTEVPDTPVSPKIEFTTTYHPGQRNALFLFEVRNDLRLLLRIVEIRGV